jgi:RHS repeat-associated protein
MSLPGRAAAAPHPNAFDRPDAAQPGAKLEYDSANRLRRVQRGSLDIRYVYDGLGNLEAEIVDDGQTVTRTDLMIDESGPLPRVVGAVTSDGSHELYAYGPTGVAVVHKKAADQPQGTTYHALTDELGTVRGLVDGTGALAGRVAYDPWGRVRVTEGEQTRLAFTGEYRDTAGLVWLRARHYAPFLGRFLQRDTVIDDPGNPQTLNRFGYAANNPSSNADPTGHVVETVLDAASLGVGIYSIASWDEHTPLWMRALDVIGVGIDTAALALPFIPGGASLMGRTGKAYDVSSVAVGLPEELLADPTGMKNIARLQPGQGAAFAVEFNTGRTAMLAGDDVPGVRSPLRNGVHMHLQRSLPGQGKNAVGGFITRRADSHWDIDFITGQLHLAPKTVGVGRARWPKVPVHGRIFRMLADSLQGTAAKHVANATGKKVYNAGELIANPTHLRWFGGLGMAYHYPSQLHKWTNPASCSVTDWNFCDDAPQPGPVQDGDHSFSM